MSVTIFNFLCSNVFEQFYANLFGPPTWPHYWYEHFCFRVKLVIIILSSPHYTQVAGDTRHYIHFLASASIREPRRPCLNSALSFDSISKNITAPVSGIFGLPAVVLDSLPPRAWTYSYKILLRSCSLLRCNNFIGLDTFSSPIVSNLSPRLGLVSLLVGYLG